MTIVQQPRLDDVPDHEPDVAYYAAAPLVWRRGVLVMAARWRPCGREVDYEILRFRPLHECDLDELRRAEHGTGGRWTTLLEMAERDDAWAA